MEQNQPQNPFMLGGFSPYAPYNPQNQGGNTGFFGGNYGLSLLPTLPMSGGQQNNFFRLPPLPMRPGQTTSPSPTPSPQPAPPEFDAGMGQMRLPFSFPREGDMWERDGKMVQVPLTPQPALPPYTPGQVFTPDISPFIPNPNQPGPVIGRDTLVNTPRVDSPTEPPVPPPQEPVRLSPEEQAREILKMAVGNIPANMQYDSNGDGRITSADALAYLKQYVRAQPPSQG